MVLRTLDDGKRKSLATAMDAAKAKAMMEAVGRDDDDEVERILSSMAIPEAGSPPPDWLLYLADPGDDYNPSEDVDPKFGGRSVCALRH